MPTALEILKTRTLTVAQVREVDQIAIRRYHMHSLVLMENAGLGCTRWLVEQFRIPPTALILCGKGNNGGDGLVIARHLQLAGWVVKVLLLGPVSKISDDAHANWQILAAEGARQCWVWDDPSPSALTLDKLFSDVDVIVDAMLGTGASGNPVAPLDDWIRRANQTKAFRVAIDIPTGLNASTGEVGEPIFLADATLTFVALKPAFQNPTAQRYLGDITVIPIGIPAAMVEELLPIAT